MRVVLVPCSFGETADRIAILTIKSERMRDPAQLENVRRALAAVSAPFFAAVARGGEFDALFAALKAVNERLWDVEDKIRDCERRGDFGAGFVALARAVYTANDERAALKRALDTLLGSELREEKSYAGGV